MKRPVWLLSMDSEQFNAPPTTTAALASYYRKHGVRAGDTHIELIHFQAAEDIDPWLAEWQARGLAIAKKALSAGLSPVIGFSFYTWNAAEFLELLSRLKAMMPELLCVAGGPHVQQAEDYLGVDPLDLIFLCFDTFLGMNLENIRGNHFSLSNDFFGDDRLKRKLY